MAKIILLIAFLTSFGLHHQSFAQYDGLTLEVSAQGESIIHHTLEEGQTLYGISKTYGVDINDLMTKNPERQVDELKIGQDILIPVRKSQICYHPHHCSTENKVPVYYTAKKQDNLFRIARIYFDSSVEQIKLLNDMTSSIVSHGQLLKIGWLPYSDYLQSYLSPHEVEVISQAAPQEIEIKEEEPAQESIPQPTLITMNEDRSDEVNTVLEGIGKKNTENNIRLFEEEDSEVMRFNPNHRKLVSQGATAYWNKNRSSKKGFYLLHKFLPVNTLIRVTNPVTNNTVLAKVVGQIPDNIYAPEITMVVTTEVAHALGAMDKKFYTKITYPDLE